MGTVLCITRCSAASLASTQEIPVASCQLWKSKVPPDVAKYPLGSNKCAECFPQLWTIGLNTKGLNMWNSVLKKFAKVRKSRLEGSFWDCLRTPTGTGSPSKWHPISQSVWGIRKRQACFNDLGLRSPLPLLLHPRPPCPHHTICQPHG